MSSKTLSQIDKVITSARNKINKIEQETKDRIESILNPRPKISARPIVFGADMKAKQKSAGLKAAKTRAMNKANAIQAKCKTKKQGPGRPRKNKK